MKDIDIWNEPPVRFKALMYLMVHGKDKSTRLLANQWNMSKSSAQRIIEGWDKSGTKSIRITIIKNKDLKKTSGTNLGQKRDSIQPIFQDYFKVKITKEEYCELINKFGKSIVDTKIRHMHTYLVDRPRKKYSNHYNTLEAWVLKDTNNGTYKNSTREDRKNESARRAFEFAATVRTRKAHSNDNIPNPGEDE